MSSPLEPGLSSLLSEDLSSISHSLVGGSPWKQTLSKDLSLGHLFGKKPGEEKEALVVTCPSGNSGKLWRICM